MTAFAFRDYCIFFGLPGVQQPESVCPNVSLRYKSPAPDGTFREQTAGFESTLSGTENLLFCTSPIRELISVKYGLNFQLLLPDTEVDPERQSTPDLNRHRLIRRFTLTSMSTGRIRLLYLLLPSIVISWPGCSDSRASKPTITWTTRRSDFTLTVTARGSVAAKNSHTLVMPRVYQRPEITYLALEGSFVHAGDVVVELNKQSFQVDLQNALSRLEIARGELEALKAQQASQRAQLESQIEIAEQKAGSARLQLSRIEFAAPRQREITRLEIEQAEVEAEKSRKKLELVSAGQKESLFQQTMVVKQVQSRADLARSHMAQLTLTSPVDGYVIYERNQSTGEMVKEGDLLHPGWSIVRIPDMSALQVVLDLSETDVQQIVEGQPVRITIPSLAYATLPGKVAQIAKAATPVRRNSRVKTVEVKVDIDSTLAGLVPGLSADCEIEAQKVEDAVLIPLDAVFVRDSLEMVYLAESESYSRRQVFIGRRGKDFAVVDSGLVGGERLALTEPDAKFVTN